MSASWVVPTLSTDFTFDFDKALIDYIKTKYSIPDPDKNNTSNKAMIFKAGFPSLDRPYCISVLEQPTDISQYLNSRDYWMNTLMDINIRMERLSPNGFDPQLGYMRREVVRILGAYQAYDIPGILEIHWLGGTPIYLPNTDIDAQAEQDWRYTVRCRLVYEMRNISMP